MKQLHRIAVLLGTMLATLILTATAAVAMPAPPLDGGGSSVPAGIAPEQPVLASTSDGLASWQIALIAIGAALFAALAIELVQVYRRRAGRQSVPAV
jgi:hypothetical protein